MLITSNFPGFWCGEMLGGDTPEGGLLKKQPTGHISLAEEPSLGMWPKKERGNMKNIFTARR